MRQGVKAAKVQILHYPFQINKYGIYGVMDNAAVCEAVYLSSTLSRYTKIVCLGEMDETVGL